LTPSDDDTVAMVELRELTELARLGLEMRRLQKAYFARRKAAPHANHDAEFRAALKAEERFESAAKAALNRERQSLPGMGGGEAP